MAKLMRIEGPSLATDLGRQISALEGRDLQLWSIGALIFLMTAAGFVALVLPNVMWNLPSLRVEGRFLPQLLFGFTVLIVLFNIYALNKRVGLRRVRETLVRELVRSEAAERLSLIDPLTDIYNRRYLDQILERETKRADRLGTSLTFLMIDLDDFRLVNTRFGHLVGDRLLSEAALLLKRTFRSTDVIFRYGGDEFLVILTDTEEPQAQRALERLLVQVRRWNEANAGGGLQMKLNCGIAAYSAGQEAEAVIHSADQRMYLDKARRPTPA